MKITYFKDYESMSFEASKMVFEAIKKEPDLLLCAATGYSPKGTYRKLCSLGEAQKSDFERIMVIKLDEWGGIIETQPETCESYLKTKLIEPLSISSNRYISFKSDPKDPLAECKRIEAELEIHGPIDVCILGLGSKGHLGFNEPATQLAPCCHVAQLTQQSLQHNMIQSMQVKPTYGLTLGMKNILSAKRIILLITGSDKDEVFDHFLKQEITSNLPASFLWLHHNVDCLVDESVINVKSANV